MPFGRIFRNVFVLAKIETTSGTDAVPTGAANAILPVGDVKITAIEADRVPRNVKRGYFGSSGSFVGSTWMKIEFATEKAGSGAAGTAPAWGPLLRACGWAEAITASTRVDYTPISTALETLSLYAYSDGLQFKCIGACGDLSGATVINGVPVYNWTFYAPYLAPTAVANPTPTLTAWKDPILANDANTSDLVIGGTYSAGAISGGTSYVSGGIEWSLGNTVSKTELIGAKRSVITDRNITGTIKTLDLTAAQEITMLALIPAATASSIGMLHGTTAGYKVLEFFPHARLLGHAYQDVDGIITSDFQFEAPPASGNDDARIVVL